MPSRPRSGFRPELDVESHEVVKLIEHMIEKGGVWLAPLEEIATHVKKCIDDGSDAPRIDKLPYFTTSGGSFQSSGKIGRLTRSKASRPLSEVVTPVPSQVMVALARAAKPAR